MNYHYSIILQTTILLSLTSLIMSAPIPDRKGKFIFDLLPQVNAPADLPNDLSRTVPAEPGNQYNSPIYYIRLPPVPYSFVPGLGYVSQHSGNSPSLLNLPIPFLGNGKPVTIYRWNGAYDLPATSPTSSKPAVPKPVAPVQPDSNIHRLPGQFTFNGKPGDVFVLRDSYNSLYDDALQNLYP